LSLSYSSAFRIILALFMYCATRCSLARANRKHASWHGKATKTESQTSKAAQTPLQPSRMFENYHAAPPVRQAPPVHSVAPRSSLPTAARPPAACSSSLCALLRGFRRAGGAPSRSADSPERAGAEVSAAQAAAPAERRHRSRRRQHSRHRTVRRTDATSSSRQVESVSISQPASAEGSARTAARVLAERRQAPRCATDSRPGGNQRTAATSYHGMTEWPYVIGNQSTSRGAKK
jgi:hypothetical protein